MHRFNIKYQSHFGIIFKFNLEESINRQYQITRLVDFNLFIQSTSVRAKQITRTQFRFQFTDFIESMSSRFRKIYSCYLIIVICTNQMSLCDWHYKSYIQFNNLNYTLSIFVEDIFKFLPSDIWSHNFPTRYLSKVHLTISAVSILICM